VWGISSRYAANVLRVNPYLSDMTVDPAANKKLRYHEKHSVPDFDTNQKLIWDFLLVINTNLNPTLRRFQGMAHYWSDFL